jgi:Uma2 family endonuclease
MHGRIAKSQPVEKDPLMSSMATVGEQRVVLDNVRWSTYLSLLEDSGSRHGRITYDQGVLELTSPSKSHEHIGRLIGRMVEAFTEDLGIEILSVASTTVKREALQRGFEADEAYYIGSADQVRSRGELDFAIDPVPDLVIEVDISRSSIGKLPIYAAFGVPEVWQYRGDTIFVQVLEGSTYREQSVSKQLPRFPIDQMLSAIGQRCTLGETELIRTFRAWIRMHVVES